MNNKFVKFLNHNRVLTVIAALFGLILVLVVTMLLLNRFVFSKKTFVDGLAIYDVEIIKDGEYYSYTATIEAIKEREVKSVDITFLDKDKKEMIKVNNIINAKLKKKQTIKINALTDVNIKEAKKIKYKVN